MVRSEAATTKVLNQVKVLRDEMVPERLVGSWAAAIMSGARDDDGDGDGPCIHPLRSVKRRHM
jgi:hypothetical protein